ncbi:MAG: hypothetical protein R2848_09205 [Thermomicrobiales bacterium]
MMANPSPESIPVIASADELDAWFRDHGSTETEHWVAFHKKSSPHFSVTLEELIDVGFCHGWVDNKGIRVDEQLRALRFTPRRPKSNWSERNRARVRQLIADDRMQPAGLARLPDDL